MSINILNVGLQACIDYFLYMRISQARQFEQSVMAATALRAHYEEPLHSLSRLTARWVCPSADVTWLFTNCSARWSRRQRAI